MFNVYNCSTITTDINYTCKYKRCQNCKKKWFIMKLDSEFDVKISPHIYIELVCAFGIYVCLWWVGGQR